MLKIYRKKGVLNGNWVMALVQLLDSTPLYWNVIMSEQSERIFIHMSRELAQHGPAMTLFGSL